MGSAFFYPRNFSDIPETELRRATFLATPVLKRTDPAEAPFAPGFLPTLAQDDPSLEVQFIVVAGGFVTGIIAIGYLASGVVAIGWTGAQGVVAIARHFAVGQQAFGSHAGDAAAQEYVANSSFLQTSQQILVESPQWTQSPLFLLAIATFVGLTVAMTKFAYRRKPQPTT